MQRLVMALAVVAATLPMNMTAPAADASDELTASEHLGSDPAAEWVFSDDPRLKHRRGTWTAGGGGSDGAARNRYCWPRHLWTDEPGAALELEFDGVGLAVVFHTPRTPVYGPRGPDDGPTHWVDGLLRARIDDRPPVDIWHNELPLEVVIADDLPPGRHRLTLEHVRNGCTLLGFRVFHQPVGHLQAHVTGDNAEALFDVRVSVWRGAALVRTWLDRNWLCGRVAITGLPPGDNYRVRVEAVGWLPWQRDGVVVRAGQSTPLAGDTPSPTIYLQQDPATRRGPIAWPALGYQAVCVPGESFQVQLAGDRPVRRAWLTRRLVSSVALPAGAGEAEIRRVASVDATTVTLAETMPPGVYDLHLVTAADETIVSPRSVVVRQQHAGNELTALTWGHTDTWGQHQAEFEQALVATANLIGPDVVLVSNSVNAAYISGAMAALEAPYLINFGNHRLAGHPRWYGSQVGQLSLGPNFVALNFGYPWSETAAKDWQFFDPGHADPGGLYHRARRELAQRLAACQSTRGKIINAYEADAPQDLLNQYGIGLIHAAHGSQRPKVGLIEGTSTMHVGKQTASSFRMVTWKDGRVASATNPPWEVARVIAPNVPVVPPPPLRVERLPDGAPGNQQAWRIVNDLPESIVAARVRLVLPAGDYQPDAGALESAVGSDDGHWVELAIRLDLPANASRTVRLNRHVP